MTKATLVKLILAVMLVMAIPAEGVLLYTQIQEATTKVATAKNARDRQLAEAELADQTAEVQLQIANNAAEQKKAEAEKLFAEARAAEDVAKNAPERQAAEAQIAVQKAETELQTAINAERRAAADADKMEAEARTAKQTALNSVLRSKAEATKVTAELSALQSKIGVLMPNTYNCANYRTFADCVEALKRATANGGFQLP